MTPMREGPNVFVELTFPKSGHPSQLLQGRRTCISTVLSLIFLKLVQLIQAVLLYAQNSYVFVFTCNIHFKASVHSFKLSCILGTSTAVFLSNDHSLYAPIYLGWTSYLISFAWDQSNCQERVGNDKIQNEKFLPTVGLEPTTHEKMRLTKYAYMYMDFSDCLFFKIILVLWNTFVKINESGVKFHFYSLL